MRNLKSTPWIWDLGRCKVCWVVMYWFGPMENSRSGRQNAVGSPNWLSWGFSSVVGFGCPYSLIRRPSNSSQVAWSMTAQRHCSSIAMGCILREL